MRQTKKSIILLAIISFTISEANATSYYFSSSSGDDSRTTKQAQNPTTPWRTIHKLDGIMSSLSGGDSVFLKRGDVFDGILQISRSGKFGNPIYFGAYSSGLNPMITGLTKLTSWRQYHKNIYYAYLDVNTLNIVTLNGLIKVMGRYPPNGYLTYNSHLANNAISGASVEFIPFDATGSEVVIRKIRQVSDRHTVSSVVGNTINYLSSTQSPHGNNNTYSPHDGNGYFIQSSIYTLTKAGDWYYDKATKRFYMYFEDGAPAANVVKASTMDRNLILNNEDYITFQNIDFEGANIDGVSIINDKDITFIGCHFLDQYNGIYGSYLVSNLNIYNCSFRNVLNDGIWIDQGGNNVTIEGTAFTNIGAIPGAGGSGDGQYVAVWVDGYHSGGGRINETGDLTVSHCTFTNLGFDGIVLYGNNTLVENNFIDSFCTVKDDGAAIYSYQTTGKTSINKTIRSNVILNAIGVISGAPPYEQFGKAAGIYLDANANNIHVIDNTVAHGPWGGIVCLGANSSILKNNLVYDFAQQLYIGSFTKAVVRNMLITGNKFVAKTADQTTLYTRIYNDPILFGTLDSNYYARLIDNDSIITIDTAYARGVVSHNITLSEWKLIYNQDLHSKTTSVSIADKGKIRFYYNSTSSNKKIPLSGSYIAIDGKRYSSDLLLKPYGSIVLIEGCGSDVCE